MLNQIRAIIRQKESFIEAADIIMGDTIGLELDDLYEEAAAFDSSLSELNHLQENGDIEPDDLTGDVETEQSDDIVISMEDADSTIQEDMEDSDGEDEEADMMDTPIESDADDEDDGDSEPDDDESTDTDSVLDSPADEPDISSEDDDEDSDELDEIGAELDEELESILSTSIDLPTNTMTDVPPVPPINAGDATVGDTFETDLMAEPVTAEKDSGQTDQEEPDDMFKEAITIDAADDSSEGQEEAPTEEEKPAADDAQNEVTDAVINKVNAAEEESDPEDVGKKVLDRLDKVNAEILRAKDAIKKQLGW